MWWSTVPQVGVLFTWCTSFCQFLCESAKVERQRHRSPPEPSSEAPQLGQELLPVRVVGPRGDGAGLVPLRCGTVLWGTSWPFNYFLIYCLKVSHYMKFVTTFENLCLFLKLHLNLFRLFLSMTVFLFDLSEFLLFFLKLKKAFLRNRTCNRDVSVSCADDHQVRTSAVQSGCERPPPAGLQTQSPGPEEHQPGGGAGRRHAARHQHLLKLLLLVLFLLLLLLPPPPHWWFWTMFSSTNRRHLTNSFLSLSNKLITWCWSRSHGLLQILISYTTKHFSFTKTLRCFMTFNKKILHFSSNH